MAYVFNPFTGNLDTTDVVAFNGEVNAGTESSPSLFFTGDPNTGIYSPGADQLAISTGGNERLRITSAGLVGIGTSAVDEKLHIEGAGTQALKLVNTTNGSYASPQLLQIKFEGSGGREKVRLETTDFSANSVGGEFRIYTRNTSDVLTQALVVDQSQRVGIGTTSPSNNLAISDDTTTSIGLIRTGASPSSCRLLNTSNVLQIDNNVNGIVFATGTTPTEKARIDSSGRLLVGTSSRSVNITAAFQGNSAGSTGLAVVHFSRGQTFTGANTGLGTIEFTDSSQNKFAVISCVSDAAVTPGSSHPGRLVFSTTADGASSPTEQLRITSDRYVRLASGTGGIQFNGDTAAANALDDYEEGTFTPTIVGTTDAGTGTYTIQVGVYTKVGNVVHYAITILWTTHTGTGNMRIDGLPFTARGLTNYNPSVTLDVNNLTSPANTIVTGTILSNTTSIGLNSVPVAGGARAALALDTAGTIWASGSYTL